MKKFDRLPREQVADQLDDVPSRTIGDGGDVEAHRARSGDGVAPRLPGTGGDFRRPSGGGEIDDSDVEGHGRQSGDGSAPRLPGTGGDF
ncbi:MAG TPA: hypothetical protein VM427_01285 [Patescibacteria group bacterium]|nr:hypothetical protein [Patescibacteria group bacterium]